VTRLRHDGACKPRFGHADRPATGAADRVKLDLAMRNETAMAPSRLSVMLSSVQAGFAEVRDAAAALVPVLEYRLIRFEDRTAQPVPSRQVCVQMAGAARCAEVSVGCGPVLGAPPWVELTQRLREQPLFGLTGLPSVTQCVTECIPSGTRQVTKRSLVTQAAGWTRGSPRRRRRWRRAAALRALARGAGP
jgi:hypothetical protein